MKPLILDTVDDVINVVSKMTWKGTNPFVHFMDKVFLKGLSLSPQEVNELNPFIRCNPILPKWDVIVLNKPYG